mmetsp:Transcript_10565/g.24139  ORF Transcript_10565/g.24139 Transcript_10565/m.24139 type:complete len:330 (-) Transcript_10565:334-1323(-)
MVFLSRSSTCNEVLFCSACAMLTAPEEVMPLELRRSSLSDAFRLSALAKAEAPSSCIQLTLRSRRTSDWLRMMADASIFAPCSPIMLPDKSRCFSVLLKVRSEVPSCVAAISVRRLSARLMLVMKLCFALSPRRQNWLTVSSLSELEVRFSLVSEEPPRNRLDSLSIVLPFTIVGVRQDFNVTASTCLADVTLDTIRSDRYSSINVYSREMHRARPDWMAFPTDCQISLPNFPRTILTDCRRAWSSNLMFCWTSCSSKVTEMRTRLTSSCSPASARARSLTITWQSCAKTQQNLTSSSALLLRPSPIWISLGLNGKLSNGTRAASRSSS